MSPKTNGDACWHQAHGVACYSSVGEFFSLESSAMTAVLFLPEGPNAIFFGKMEGVEMTRGGTKEKGRSQLTTCTAEHVGIAWCRPCPKTPIASTHAITASRCGLTSILRRKRLGTEVERPSS